MAPIITNPLDVAPIITHLLDVAPIITHPLDVAPIITHPLDVAPIITHPLDVAPIITHPLDVAPHMSCYRMCTPRAVVVGTRPGDAGYGHVDYDAVTMMTTHRPPDRHGD